MSRNKIQNPILRGFNPDPSISLVRVDYYLAVSTFEWYPGVQIYHSSDLENWQLGRNVRIQDASNKSRFGHGRRAAQQSARDARYFG